MRINVDVNTTKKDYYAFQLYHSYRFAWIYAFIFIMDVALLVALLSQWQKTGEVNSFLAFVLAIGIVAFVYIVANNIIRMVKTAKLEDSKPVFHYTFTKGTMHCDADGNGFDLAWSQLYKVIETKKMFLVYVNKEAALIVPKSSFNSNEDIEAFRENILFKPGKFKGNAKTSKNKGKKK